jgi:hypothetical protein
VQKNFYDVIARSKNAHPNNFCASLMLAGNRILRVMLKRLRPRLHPATLLRARKVQGLAFLNHLK